VIRHGWAIECRVYAEDPLRNFLPSIGTLSAYRPPDEAACNVAADIAMGVAPGSAGAGTVRVDDGVAEGGEISVHYDPMIAKLITHGRDREHARQLMIAALDRYCIWGASLRHNTNFLRSMMVHPRFITGHITTGFIPEEFPGGYHGHQLSASDRRSLVCAAAALEFVWASQARSLSGSPEAARLSATELSIKVEGEAEPEHAVTVARVCASSCGRRSTGLPAGPGCELLVSCAGAADSDNGGGAAGWTRHLRLLQSGLGPSMVLEAESAGEGAEPGTLVVQVQKRLPLGWQVCAFGTVFSVLSRPAHYAALAAHMKPPPPSPFAGSLLSPMPGTLHSLAVEVGSAVTAGQEVCVVEAMKMQNVLVAQRDGVVSKLYASAGDTLAADQPIVGFKN
jgi:propionyl-CoA carboxylase alpha chain